MLNSPNMPTTNRRPFIQKFTLSASLMHFSVDVFLRFVRYNSRRLIICFGFSVKFACCHMFIWMLEQFLRFACHTLTNLIREQARMDVEGLLLVTGGPGVLRFMGSQRVRHDWVTELNWTCYISSLSFPSRSSVGRRPGACCPHRSVLQLSSTVY